MTFKYKKELLIGAGTLSLCLLAVFLINVLVFNDNKTAALNDNVRVIGSGNKKVEVQQAITVPYTVPKTNSLVIVESVHTMTDDLEYAEEPAKIGAIPFEKPPVFKDDGSIIYDGMTLTELTNKLNKSLKSYMTNTGYFFAKYTKDYGMDPYLAVAISMHETGCGRTGVGCSTLAVKCNNFGGLTGGNQRCSDGSRWSKYDTIEEGINAYLGIIYKRYYLKGKTTPEAMAYEYADGSPTWAGMVGSFYNSVKNK